MGKGVRFAPRSRTPVRACAAPAAISTSPKALETIRAGPAQVGSLTPARESRPAAPMVPRRIPWRTTHPSPRGPIDGMRAIPTIVPAAYAADAAGGSPSSSALKASSRNGDGTSGSYDSVNVWRARVHAT